VSPLLYIQLIWQTLAGALVFDHMPGLSAVAGGVLIVVSGLIVLWSQRAPRS
jgi:drug/metabolite transporter (DMT)-like permease